MCIFCDKIKDPNSCLYKGKFWSIIKDGYPVSPGHLLCVLNRHAPSFFMITTVEHQELFTIIQKAIALITEEHEPDGYNVGVNIGEASGQTIPHVHIHVIPRYKGDVDNPRGGVRGVIPSKQSY